VTSANAFNSLLGFAISLNSTATSLAWIIAVLLKQTKGTIRQIGQLVEAPGSASERGILGRTHVYAIVFTEMTRKRPKVMRKKKGLEPPASVPIDPIEARFLLIEGRLSRVEDLLDLDPVAVFGDQRIPLYGSFEIYGEAIFRPEPQRRIPRPGLSPLITPIDFAHRRDRMVYLVESNWPVLERIFSKSYASPRELRHALLVHFPEWRTDVAFRFLRGVAHPLWKYLDATKYVKPRKLAYAMAGTPELTWRTSLDRCEFKEPSKLPIHFNAMRNHIQACHPKWYSQLLEEGLTPKTQKMLPGNCDECRRFIDRTDRIMPAIGDFGYLTKD
jgi:hypothetical protein